MRLSARLDVLLASLLTHTPVQQHVAVLPSSRACAVEDGCASSTGDQSNVRGACEQHRVFGFGRMTMGRLQATVRPSLSTISTSQSYAIVQARRQMCTASASRLPTCTAAVKAGIALKARASAPCAADRACFPCMIAASLVAVAVACTAMYQHCASIKASATAWQHGLVEWCKEPCAHMRPC